MKTELFIPILLLLFLGCEKEKADKIVEVPDGVIVLKLCDNLEGNLKALFPEKQNTTLSKPDFFSDTIQKNIVLIKESKVYVSFIDEGAGYKNSLCWYSFNNSQHPLKVSDISGYVLFPNFSKIGEGGELEAGYTLQLGTNKFTAGTVIGFFLVENGWNDGIVDYSGTTHYTNYDFNLGGKQQHLLFKDANCNDIVFAFEDISFVDEKCDKDYNDILFAVSDNNEGYEATSFDLSNVIVK